MYSVIFFCISRWKVMLEVDADLSVVGDKYHVEMVSIPDVVTDRNLLVPLRARHGALQEELHYVEAGKG